MLTPEQHRDIDHIMNHPAELLRDEGNRELLALYLDELKAEKQSDAEARAANREAIAAVKQAFKDYEKDAKQRAKHA